MPTVLGTGPFEFTDPTTMKQVSIPLSALKFVNNQLQIDAATWALTYPASVINLLGAMGQQGLIVPAPTPSSRPAMVITAANNGSAGNGIQVAISNVVVNTDPTLTKFNVAVTDTKKYVGLTLAAGPNNIETVLGSDTVTGPATGLVHVLHSGLANTGLPAAILSPGTSLVSTAPNKAKLDVKTATPPGTAVLFTLEARAVGNDGDLTKVIIDNVSTTNNTFDLTVTWTKSVTNVTVGSLPSGLSPLGYEILVSTPPIGIFSAPSVTTIQLAGGQDGSSPVAASAIVSGN